MILFFFIVPFIIVYLTFKAPFWIKLILTALNMFLLPDFVPFIDEILQLYNVFNSLLGVKVAKGVNSVRNFKKFIDKQ